jgi:hypothetical protein
MAEFDLNLGVAFGTQSAVGTVNSTVAALSGALSSTNGIVLGDADSGVGNSGITYQTIRNFRDKAYVSGSFTRPPSDFIGERIQAFDFSFPLKGNGATISGSPADSEYTPLAGVDAILKGCGLTGAGWGSGNGWQYTPASATPLTAKIFDSGMYYVFMDLFGSLSISWTPGSIAVATVSFVGTVSSFGALTFPTLTYGAQATLSAPSVASVVHSWGMSATARGYSTATTTLDNQLEDVPDSNAVGGIRPRQTGRSITHSATVYSDSTDLDYERTEMVRTTIATEALKFTVGTAAGAAATQNAYYFEIPTPECRSIQPNKLGVARAMDVELVAVGATAASEFILRFI